MAHLIMCSLWVNSSIIIAGTPHKAGYGVGLEVGDCAVEDF